MDSIWVHGANLESSNVWNIYLVASYQPHFISFIQVSSHTTPRHSHHQSSLHNGISTPSRHHTSLHYDSTTAGAAGGLSDSMHGVYRDRGLSQSLPSEPVSMCNLWRLRLDLTSSSLFVQKGDSKYHYDVSTWHRSQQFVDDWWSPNSGTPDLGCTRLQ